MDGLLTRYKDWVKRHPGVVQNLDWLLLLTVWNPGRTNGGSEATYEAYHAAVGLLSLWHQSILEEGELPTSRPSPYLWLDAIEYVETLIELRGMHLEASGKMSRYAPLMVVETIKSMLKMLAWSRYSGHVFLRRPTPDDLHQFESELGLQDILESLDRLRCKYSSTSTAAQLQRRASVLSPGEPKPAPAAASGSACGDCRGSEPPVVIGASACAADSSQSAAANNDAGGCRSSALVPAGGCCSGAVSTAGYGLREYVAEGLGWVRSLVPQRAALTALNLASSAGALSLSCAMSSAPASCGNSNSSTPCSSRSGDSSTGTDAQVGGGSSSEWTWGNLYPLSDQQEGEMAVKTSVCSIRGCEGVSTSGRDQLPPPPPAQQQQGSWWQRIAVGGGSRVECGVEDAGLGDEDSDAHMGRNLMWLAELMHIWRPVVYVTMLKRYGRRSWRPWLVSLAVDLLSGHFHRRGRQHLAEAEARAVAEAVAIASGMGVPAEAEGGRAAACGRSVSRVPAGAGTSLLSLALARSLATPGVTAGEERELHDRRRKLLLYGLRSPFLETTTLALLSLLRKSTKRVPLVGFGADYLYGLTETFTAYYSYTSGSN